MRHRKEGRKLKRTSDERRALLKSLANSLILHNKIQTTQAKAKALRPFVERLITKAKEPGLANRRYVLRFLTKKATQRLFSKVAPKYKERPGGYTRITKIGYRKGDNAPIAQIELI